MRLRTRAALGTVACLLALPAGAFGATFTVNSPTDAPDFSFTDPDCDSTATSNVCTLRAAVQQARGTPGSDTINLPADSYQLTEPGPDEGPGATGDLDLGVPTPNAPEAITIRGAGARSTIITQTTNDRVFHLESSPTTANLSGLTVAGGNSVSQGGGILNALGTLNLSDVAIVGNASGSDGGGLSSGGTSNLARVTVSGNSVDGGGAPAGGGVATFGRIGSLSLTNVTISGNTATDSDGTGAEGAGLFFDAGSGSLLNVTLAGNTIEPAGSTGGGGAFIDNTLNLRNTIVAGNRVAGGALSNCIDNGGSTPFANSLGNNLEETAGCGFADPTDKPNTNPLLGPLANNGGQTNTRALLASSPAFDAGSTPCPSTDQRGVVRPQNLICDIGAFEFVPTILQPGPPPPPSPPPPLSPPRLGRTVNVREVSGRVYYAIPPRATAAGVRTSQKGLRFRPLREARQLPVRSFLNTRRGSVRLTSARPRAGKTQSGVFTSGLFQILQSRKKRAKGLTELRLKGSSFRRCKPRARKPGKDASAAISRRRIRRLRARGRGRFRTRGRYSAATVRGTKWLTQDRCDGTLTKVTQGRVAVRDFRRKRTITIKRGKSYLAKSRSRG